MPVYPLWKGAAQEVFLLLISRVSGDINSFPREKFLSRMKGLNHEAQDTETILPPPNGAGVPDSAAAGLTYSAVPAVWPM